jgi:hypothetical protein
MSSFPFVFFMQIRRRLNSQHISAAVFHSSSSPTQRIQSLNSNEDEEMMTHFI